MNDLPDEIKTPFCDNIINIIGPFSVITILYIIESIYPFIKSTDSNGIIHHIYNVYKAKKTEPNIVENQRLLESQN